MEERGTRGPERGKMLAGISKAILGIHRQYYGRGASSARTLMDHDYVICFLEDIYTPAERTLVEAGEIEAVTQTRLAFQRAMQTRFTEVVEQATGRTVRAFLSQTHIKPDISCEIFVLQPDDSHSAATGSR